MTIGSRKSRLAVIQSEQVLHYLEQRGIHAELLTMKTQGDRILDRPLELIGGKGLFVKELEQALLDGRADILVHSLKDVPADVPPELPILGYSKREDPRDVLVLPEGTVVIDRAKPVGCSSKRRVLQARRIFPEAEFQSVRGNVETRLKKLDEGRYGALILAAAGLKRLGLSGRISRYFSTEEMIPSAGQGILAVQGRKGADYLCLEEFFHEDAAIAARCERAVTSELAADCSAPVAAYARIEQGELVVAGMYAPDGADEFRTAVCRGALSEPEQLGRRLARELMG